MLYEPNDITKKIKAIVRAYDPLATIILFGSRARGDWEQESDWDFLVLTDKSGGDIRNMDDHIKNDIWKQIDMVTCESVQIIVRNREDWESNYAVTGLYESVKDEGVEV